MATNRDYWAFTISGVVLMLLIGGIKFLNGASFSLTATLLVFAFGGMVGIVGLSPHTSFIKNLLFASVIGLVIWALLAPVETIGNSTIIQNLEFWFIVAIAVAFFEREIWNAIARVMNKPVSQNLGFIGNIVILIWFVKSPLWSQIWGWVADHMWYVMIFLLVYWVIFFYLISRFLSRTSQSVAGYYGARPSKSNPLDFGEVFTSLGWILRKLWELPLSYKLMLIGGLAAFIYLQGRAL